MKIVLAPDKFKESLTGLQFCKAAEKGIKSVHPDAEVLWLPMADGGDGTIEVVQYYLGGETISLTVNDPLFRPISASYIYTPQKKIAYIEMATASGLRLLQSEEINCLLTTTLGTGEIIHDAIKKGAKEIILGIGGSATNDGGMGMATALGFQFLDANGKPLAPIGKNLGAVHSVKSDRVNLELKRVKFKVACDVTNPFYGTNGAAYVYASQKGASPDEIRFLDRGLEHYARVLGKYFGKDVQKIPGSGAAGGMGGAAIIFLGASLEQGIELIKTIAEFDKKIVGADWIITGEGKLDEQTLEGKTIAGVLSSAQSKNIPVAAFCGKIDLPISKAEQMGLAYTVGVSDSVNDIKTAMEQAGSLVTKTAREFALKFFRRSFDH